ncbi:MAG: hypothetical protein ACTSRU_19725 [Candidatus Hodarchaeales archaeon]
MTNVLNEYLTEAEESQLKVNRQYTDAYEKISRCTYEVFYKNPHGEELRVWLEKVLKYLCGDSSNFAYVQGQQDMIRTLLGYAETIKRQNKE